MKKIKLSLLKLKKHITYWSNIQIAKIWLKFFKIKQNNEAGNFSFILFSILLLISSILIVSFLSIHFSALSDVNNFKSLFLNVGNALIGATAIVFTLIIFALQVNIERMPYGLFKSLSSDKRLLFAFISSFLLSIMVACLSIFTNEKRIMIDVFIFLWSIIAIINLFMYAYKRSLLLINPIQQLDLLTIDTQKSLLDIKNKFLKVDVLIKNQVPIEEKDLYPKHDLSRVYFFQQNIYWTFPAKRAIKYAISFALSNANKNDHEISIKAFNSILAIHTTYIEAKGETFFTDFFIEENPMSTDGFINYTFEELRKTLKSAITNKDEQLIEYILKTFCQLAIIYSKINYFSKQEESKIHSSLATGYLISGIKEIIPLGMPDVLMESSRYLSQVIDNYFKNNAFFNANSPIELLGILAAMGSIKEEYGPVTNIAMQELTNLLYGLITTPKNIDKFLIQNITKTMTTCAKLHLISPITPLEGKINNYINPYFSTINLSSFLSSLSIMVNALLDSEKDNKEAAYIISNIAKWSDGLYIETKEILLSSVKLRSSFTIDIIQWIQVASNTLMAALNSKACNSYNKKTLEKYSSFLLHTLTWVPIEKESIQTLESANFTEIIFELIRNAQIRNCKESAQSLQKYLIEWGFTSGAIATGYATFENTILALTILTLKYKIIKKDELLILIKKQVTHSHYSEEQKEFFSKEIKNINIYNTRGYSPIEYEVNELDKEKVISLFSKIIDNIMDKQT